MKTEITHTGKKAEIFQSVANSITRHFPSRQVVKKVMMTPVALVISITLLSASAGMGRTTKPDSAIKIPVSELRTNMRQLMEDHVALTRNVILCLVADEPGIDSTVKEIVDNQLATAALMKRYYGADAGKELARLFYRNITRAADVMIACRNGHTNAYERADKKWKESTDELISFLTQANPSWKMYGTKKMLYDEMKNTTEEIKKALNKPSIRPWQTLRHLQIYLVKPSSSIFRKCSGMLKLYNH